MGIERFFSTINRNFKIINTIDLNNVNNQKLIVGKYLFLDFNAIIHTVSSKLISDLNNKKSKYSNAKLDDLEYLIIKEVNKFIISILETIDLESLDLVYAAIDGVPLFSKILEQKKRRFMGDFVEKLLEQYSLPFNWSKNNISPGTVFMDKMSKFLNNIKLITKGKLVKKEDLILEQKDYKYYNNIKKFDYSDASVPGEGEMKIYDYINSLKVKKKDRILFFSPDNDVILLSMISKNANNIDIVKYEEIKDKMTKEHSQILSIIPIDVFNQALYTFCEDRIEGSNFKDLNIKKLIKDIAFIFTIFGNDFVPKCEAIQTNLDFFFIIDMYLINLIDHGYLLSNGNIINQTFLSYLSLLGSHEKRLLFRNSYQNIYNNFRYANQKNFIIDLYKLKLGLHVNNQSKKFSDPFYNFYNNIIYYIDPFKIKEFIEKEKNPKKKYHGCLEFYLLDQNKLFNIIKKSLKIIFPINDLLNIDISKINEKTWYDKLLHMNFKSNIKKHMMNMKDLSPRETELYLINEKLDKYHSLFNPISEFYLNIQKIRKINEPFYYNKYFNGDNKKQVVSTYLKGFRWIFDYYFNRQSTSKNKTFVDETWYYPYYKSPLFSTLVEYYSSIDHKPKAKKLDLNPIEHLLYITPIRLSQLLDPKFFMLFAEYKNGKFTDEKFVHKIKLFIEKHPQFFYNLDEIYYSVHSGNLKKSLFDCSSSSFVNKCHYKILDFVVDINQFVTKLRQIQLL